MFTTYKEISVTESGFSQLIFHLCRWSETQVQLVCWKPVTGHMFKITCIKKYFPQICTQGLIKNFHCIFVEYSWCFVLGWHPFLKWMFRKNAVIVLCALIGVILVAHVLASQPSTTYPFTAQIHHSCWFKCHSVLV